MEEMGRLEVVVRETQKSLISWKGGVVKENDIQIVVMVYSPTK